MQYFEEAKIGCALAMSPRPSSGDVIRDPPQCFLRRQRAELLYSRPQEIRKARFSANHKEAFGEPGKANRNAMHVGLDLHVRMAVAGYCHRARNLQRKSRRSELISLRANLGHKFLELRPPIVTHALVCL